MKRFTLGLIALAGLALSSCDMNSEQSAKNSIKVIDIITPLDGGETTASEGTYEFNLNFTHQTGSITASGVSFDGREHGFMVTDATMQNGFFYAGNLVTGVIANFSANIDGSASMPIKNSRFVFSPGVLGQQCLVATYEIGNDYRVRTFPTIAIFSGTTNTTYPGMNGQTSTFENKNMGYAVRLNLKTNKADVSILNAKFSSSEKEPEKSEVLIENLDVTLSGSGILIQGGDITPKIYEGGKYTEYPSFNVKNFVMNTTGAEMINASANYMVEHTMKMGTGENAVETTMTYNGTFSGAYTAIPTQN